jgi:hypothetical protein
MASTASGQGPIGFSLALILMASGGRFGVAEGWNRANAKDYAAFLGCFLAEPC